MVSGELLAYLAGIMDGDGYIKLTRSIPRPSSVHYYYKTTIGVQQLWPGEAVQLFAATFGGSVTKPDVGPGQRAIARWEVHVRLANAALRRLLPFLLVKKGQALAVLQASWLRHRTGRRSPERFAGLESIYQGLNSLHEGSATVLVTLQQMSDDVRGLESLGPAESGWTHSETLAYLAGVVDSDGNFRIEKKRVQDMLNPHYRINVRCKQVIPSPAVALLAKTFGGSLAVTESRWPNRRDMIEWGLHARAAEGAVRALLPFLVVKRTEACFLLELRHLKSRGKLGQTQWVHRNRWHDSVAMKKRCYTQAQVSQFEEPRRKVQAAHRGEPGDGGRG